MNLLPFDELHRIEEMLWDADLKKESQKIVDTLYDFFLYSYVLGKTAAEEMLGKELNEDVSEKAQAAIERVKAGESKPKTTTTPSSTKAKEPTKPLKPLIIKYASEEDVPSLVRVAETEMHRDYGEGLFDTAKALGATTKTWQTMLDNKVRDPHWLLEGVTVPIDEMFFVDGYEARFPGDFGTPELDCNCRCYLEVK